MSARFGFAALRSLPRRLRRDERGSTTVEMVLWTPFFVAMLCLVFDASMLVFSQSRLIDAARNASRAVAIGAASEDQARDWIKERLGNLASVETVIVVDGPFVTTSVSAPFASAMVFGGALLSGNRLAAEVSMIREGGQDDE